MTQATARLEARIPVEIHQMLRHAAAIQGRTLTDFIISAVRSEAEKAIAQHHAVSLSMRDQLAFADALINPGEPTEAMRNAKRHYEELISND